MFDFWLVEVFADSVIWHVFVEPVGRRDGFWLDFMGFAKDNLAKLFRDGAAEDLVVFFVGVEEFEAIVFTSGKVGAAIGHAEFLLSAGDGDEEDAEFFVGRIAGMADIFEVARES